MKIESPQVKSEEEINEENANQNEESSPASKKRKMSNNEESLASERLKSQNTTIKIEKQLDDSNVTYESSVNKIKLTSLKDKLIRFKLLGPLSTTILANVLQTIERSNE